MNREVGEVRVQRERGIARKIESHRRRDIGEIKRGDLKLSGHAPQFRVVPFFSGPVVCPPGDEIMTSKFVQVRWAYPPIVFIPRCGET